MHGDHKPKTRAALCYPRSARALKVATEVYGGRSFQEAVLAARAGRGEFRIISGGLGLIRGDLGQKSYESPA